MDTDSPLAKAVELGASFERHGVPYAIGGALAYGVWGIPRATLDVDINVFVDETALAPVVTALESLGVVLDAKQAEHDAAAQGMFVVRYDGYRVDVFTASIPFCAEAARTRVSVSIESRAAWFLSAESVAVFKMLFYRPKDLVDLERLVAVRGADLDVGYVRQQLVDTVGLEDLRITRWDQLTGRVRASPDQEYVVERALLLRGSKLFSVLKGADGLVLEIELDRQAVGTFRDGDRVRIGLSGGLELVSRAHDLSRGR